MGKDWDSDKGGREQWIAWMTGVMLECLRVLKPGAHGLVWALPRTSHWTAMALENAGFEIRDVITHLFGTGFPKSHNLGNGWGTALKPASEHWILIRRPCSEKTVAANVARWGVGGINIDGCRIEAGQTDDLFRSRRAGFNSKSPCFNNAEKYGIQSVPPTGRFPANLVLDEVAAEMLDEQSGECKSRGEYKDFKATAKGIFQGGNPKEPNKYANQSGGASRFFYCAKASKAERNAGLDGFPKKDPPGSKRSAPAPGRSSALGSPRENHHPTVKSLKLMTYLCRLVTPIGGIVLDPFMGSGSTGLAAKSEGFDFIGIEQNPEYFKIAEARLAGES